MRARYTNRQPLGISQAHRQLLSRLHRKFAGPFTSGEAADCLQLPAQKVNRLLAHWAARGWLSRVRRGTYVTVPLEAVNPSEWRRDPWVMATSLFSPCYIGGWSAAEHWGLTEQIFADVVVFTASDVRRRRQTIKGTTFVLTTSSKNRMFGLRPVWRDNARVQVSSPARTVIDILNNPRIGGGIKHVAQIAEELIVGEHRDDKTLVEFAKQLGNKTVCKRLGFILESSGLATPELLAFCRENVSAGYSKLDPGIQRKGRLIRRWNLEVNAELPVRGDTA